jgi:hypothetical protein
VKTTFTIGSPDTRGVSTILTDTGDIEYPVLIVSRNPNGKNFDLIHEKNIPHHPSSTVSIKRFVKDKYINSDENNINLEIYSYNPPVYFNCEYTVTFFCEYVEHASDFQVQFLNRLNQRYMPIQSKRFSSMYFDVI